jgi:hypothetical protein
VLADASRACSPSQRWTSRTTEASTDLAGAGLAAGEADHGVVEVDVADTEPRDLRDPRTGRGLHAHGEPGRAREPLEHERDLVARGDGHLPLLDPQRLGSQPARWAEALLLSPAPGGDDGDVLQVEHAERRRALAAHGVSDLVSRRIRVYSSTVEP